jgi:hypothetical protein
MESCSMGTEFHSCMMKSSRCLLYNKVNTQILMKMVTWQLTKGYCPFTLNSWVWSLSGWSREDDSEVILTKGSCALAKSTWIRVEQFVKSLPKSTPKTLLDALLPWELLCTTWKLLESLWVQMCRKAIQWQTLINKPAKVLKLGEKFLLEAVFLENSVSLSPSCLKMGRILYLE